MVTMETTEALNTTVDLPQSEVGYSIVERVIEAAILSVIFLVAVTGNLLLWIVIFRRKSLRTTSNALILCLSSADLLVALINMPFTIFTILKGDWVFGEAMCVFFGTLNMITFIASVMSLAAISINRYILIVHPNKFRKVYTKRNTALFIAGVWMLSLALASPPLYGWASYGYLEGQSFCFCKWTEDVAYTFFMVGVCFGGPCSVMSYCYFKILRVFKESQKNISQNSTAKRRGSFGSARDNCIVKLKNKLEPNYNRSSLPLVNSDGSQNQFLTTKVDCGCYGNGNVIKLPTSMEVAPKSRPMTSFQPQSTQTAKTVSSNTNNAVEASNTSLSSLQSSNDLSGKNPISPSPTSPEYTKRDTAVDFKPSKSWKSPFKRSRREKTSSRIEYPSGIQPDLVSTDDFSNPFANSISVVDMAAQVNLTGNKRAVPAGLCGTPNGPSSSRMARKKKRREEEMRLTKSFMVVIFVFILCWFPFCITMFWSVFIQDNNKSVPRPIDMASLLLGFANSCCNPIIYGVMNRKFRAGFKSLLCWWKDHNTVNPWKPPNV